MIGISITGRWYIYRYRGGLTEIVRYILFIDRKGQCIVRCRSVQCDQITFPFLKDQRILRRGRHRKDFPVSGSLLTGSSFVAVISLHIQVITITGKGIIFQLKTGIEPFQGNIEREREEVPFTFFGEGIVYRYLLIYC